MLRDNRKDGRTEILIKRYLMIMISQPSSQLALDTLSLGRVVYTVVVVNVILMYALLPRHFYLTEGYPHKNLHIPILTSTYTYITCADRSIGIAKYDLGPT